MRYKIAKKNHAPAKNEAWDGQYWGNVEALNVDKFHSRGTDYRPVTKCKVAHSGRDIHIFFRVEDKYVRSVHTNPQDMVCCDSCVEFFVSPKNPDNLYFNFEVNAGGNVLLYYMDDPAVKDSVQLAMKASVSNEWLEKLNIEHSMPAVVDPEITEPTVWTIQYTVPVELFEAYMGKEFGDLSGQTWKANFYKCGDQTSHPHWASWADVGELLNFHKPEKFQPIEFE